VPVVDAWTPFTELLAALVDATHNRSADGSSFEAALAAFVRLVEADAAARLADYSDGAIPPQTPLSDPGIRQLLGGLIDLAGYTSGQGEDFRELRELLKSYEATAPDPP
jgi:hypothetical protein